MRRISHLILWTLLFAACRGELPVAPATATPAAGGPTQTPAAVVDLPTATIVSAIELLSRPTATETPIPPTPTPTPRPTHTPSPTPTATVPVALVEVEGATLPPGFSLVKFADMFRPTSLTTDPQGRLFATSQDGTIHAFVDEDGDGRADVDLLFSYGFNIPLGITFGPDGQTVYVSSNSKISILRDTDGDLVADEVSNLVSGLPFGRHQNDNLKFGPDGLLYMGVGSTCDACDEVDRRSATIMRFDPATGQGEVIATGLRNPYDLAFHPFTGDLFATDNGRDDLGMEAPREELNLIFKGADYGWPDCWDEQDGPGCQDSVPAVAFFEPHSSANSMDFYVEEQFPPAYRSSPEAAVAYVAVLGSWLKPEVETGIARVRLVPEGNSYRGEVSWFAQWPGGMPLGLIAAPDGALFVGDYINDVIYRISYGD